MTGNIALNGNYLSGDGGDEGVFVDSSGNVGIGTLSPSAKLHISEGNLELDNTTNANQFGTITKGGNRFIHDFNYGDNGSVTTSGLNTFIGDSAGNFTMGSSATGAHEASYNTIIGNGAFTSNTRGYSNIALGYVALAGNTTGDGNFALGNNSLQLNTNGRENIAIGRFAGTYIANGSSANSTGDFSLFLGTSTKALADNNQNQIVIGYNATGIGSNSVVLGNDSIVTTALKGNVGIGTTSPSEELDVNGTVNATAFSIGGTAITATAAELNYVDGVTSAIQTQIDAIGAPEGTAVLSTGEGGGSKFLREDGDGTSSWQSVTAGTVDVLSNVATDRILGRTTAGSGDSEELTASATRTFLNVEDGATADQTGAQIKTAYEAEANAFTDTKNTKLSGIEAGADVTDATNVTSAGALMDSEVTNLTQVKAFDSTDYAAALGADDNYVTDAEKTVIGNTSGTNSGDQDLSALAPIANPTFTGEIGIGSVNVSEQS